MRLLLVGCGNMGTSLLKGWVQMDLFNAVDIIRPSGQKPDIQSDIINVYETVQRYDQTPDVVVLAVKPQMFAEVLADYGRYEEALFMSIAAGKTIANIQEDLGAERSVIRVMPNTPSETGKGMSGLYAPRDISAEHKEIADRMMRQSGKVLWLEDEDQMHGLTSISGSGPAYIFHMIEALAAAAKQWGFDEGDALLLARETVEGAASLSMHAHGAHPKTLRENVTSRNGVTQAGLEVLMAELSDLMTRTTRAAAKRSRELSD